MANITTRTLSSLAKRPGKWLSERLHHGHGSLVFRALANGSVAVYFRYLDSGRRVSLPLGSYNEKGAGGLSLVEARDEADKLSKKHAGGITAVREHIAAETRAKNEQLRKAAVGTFEQLLDGYVLLLQEDGKDCARQVKTLFTKWIKDAHPDLLPLRASEISHDDIMRILTGVTAAGIGRTTNKLRSFLLAAFNRAINAAGDPSLAALIGAGYNIAANPVSATRRVQKFEKARDRVLTEAELRRYIRALDGLPLMQASALHLALMLGGQRPQQVLRVAPVDVDLQAGTIRLLDPKGRRSQPRVHMLPLPAPAVPLLENLLAINGAAPHLFSSDGKRALSVTTLSHAVAEISGGKFQLRDVRRTVETMLATMGISKDLRAQVLSHGISGVQDRHYDKHGYMAEKHTVLEAWNVRLEDIAEGRKPADKVIALRKG